MKKIALFLIAFNLVWTLFPTSKVAAKSKDPVEQEGYIEQVISSYETVYNKSPYVKLYDENFIYKTITFNRNYSYKIIEEDTTTVLDVLRGYIRKKYVYKYTLN